MSVTTLILARWRAVNGPRVPATVHELVRFCDREFGEPCTFAIATLVRNMLLALNPPSED
jgi:hypothetical protein